MSNGWVYPTSGSSEALNSDFSSSDSIKGSTSASEREDEEKDVRISQYPHRVIDVSSQYGSDTSISYTAFNIIGRQSKFPDYGDFPETFAMRTYGLWWDQSPGAAKEIMPQNSSEVPVHDFIVVEFEEYVLPHSVTIFETYNPGTVVNIWAYVKHLQQWFRLWSGPPTCWPERVARKFTPPIKRINHPTKIIRIEFNHSCSDYFTEIDAVLLRGVACRLPAKSNHNINDLTSNGGYIIRRLQQFELKVASDGDHHKEILKNFLTNDLNTFIQDSELAGEQYRTLTLTDIPCEILLKIMSYLDLKSLFKLTQTCRSLYTVGTDPVLYRALNLRPYWNVVNDSVLATLAKRATYLRRLDLSWCGLFNAISPAAFKDFIRRCGEQLLDLRLNSCQFINVSCMEVVGQVCKNLKELSLRNYSAAILNFHCVKNFHQLERLDLFRTNVYADLLLMMLRYNTHLKHLNLGICPPHVNMDDVAIQISKYNPDIVSIDMWKSHFLSSVGLRALANCTKLEEVDFGWCLRTEAVPGEGLKALLRGCGKLKKLFLAAIRGLSDRDLISVAESCPLLEQLDLMGVLGISREGYFHVLRHCKHLKLLDLSFCEPNDDIQIALWRDAFGVDIKWFNPVMNQNMF